MMVDDRRDTLTFVQRLEFDRNTPTRYRNTLEMSRTNRSLTNTSAHENRDHPEKNLSTIELMN